MTALVVEDVTVAFGGNRALDGVSVVAEPGVVTGLIGPNGAGKTTLFNVVCGLLAPQRGEVSLGGRNLNGLPPFKRSRLGLARTFQRLELFGLLTAHENVRLAADVAGRERPDAVAAALLERVGMAHRGDVRADQLPTGQARRVELARALATGPTVLLLDEPASGQDEQETAAFRDILRDIAGDGVAVVLVEHDVQLVMSVCDVVHVLDFGRVIATGTPDEVQHDSEVRRAYLGAMGVDV